MAEQLALLEVPDGPAVESYFENRGPRDWRPVEVVTRYGKSTGVQPPPFRYVRTGRFGPKNVAIKREDGHVRVVPVRTLRRQNPAP